MTLPDIANLRLFNQQIYSTQFTTAKDIVSWMGAMQAQDYAMSKWGVGIRLNGASDKVVEEALNQGEILRTHVLRPTWHLVAAEDICWMLELTAPRIKASVKSRHKQLELSDFLLHKTNDIIGNALSGGKHLTRAELVSILAEAGIATDNNRASHIMFWAELDGIICSGPIRSTMQTYALLSERVPEAHGLPKDEALAKLAQKYFRSHGPATLYDFAWWSGLSAGDTRRALEMIKTELVSETIGTATYWFSNHVGLQPGHSAYLLPAFDEFLISYKDRSATLTMQDFKRAVSINGMFWPIVVIDGQVAGTWKRTVKKNDVIIAVELFEKQQPDVLLRIEEAAVVYGNFMGKKTQVSQSVKTGLMH